MELLIDMPPPCFEGTFENIEACPNAGGVYLLQVKLIDPVSIKRPIATVLSVGDYVYAGSAHGPGGLQARLRRHLTRKKKQRWHIDQVTTQAPNIQAVAWLEGSECLLVERLNASGVFFTPVKGFGSSDCKGCLSHLLVRNDILQR